MPTHTYIMNIFKQYHHHHIAIGSSLRRPPNTFYLLIALALSTRAHDYYKTNLQDVPFLCFFGGNPCIDIFSTTPRKS